jgi:glycosyltransferase involved in cell wall biosynthesis
MKIVAYASSLAPAGGVERVISKHISFLAQKNTVVLLTKDSRPSFYSLPANVIHDSLNIQFQLNLKSRIQRVFIILTGLLNTSWKLHQYLKCAKPDMIYVSSPLGLLELQLAKFFAWEFSLRDICVTEHSSYSSYNFFYKWIVKVLYGRVGLLCVPTKSDYEYYLHQNIQCQYVPNPLPFHPSKFSHYGNKVVLNVGRLTDDKQHHVLIDIWSQIQGKDGWVLKIIGAGENIEALQSQIASLDLQSSIKIFPPTKNIEDEYAAASIFALSSRAEGFGLVLLEAMACGLPCIAFDCPSGPRDIVRNAHTGFLITPGDNSSFIKNLEGLMASQSERQTLGEQAKLDAILFNGDLISTKLNDLCDAIFTKDIKGPLKS